MNDRLQALLEDFSRLDSYEPAMRVKAQRRTAWVGEFTTPEVIEYLQALQQIAVPVSTTQEEWLKAGFVQVSKKVQAASRPKSPADVIAPADQESVSKLVDSLYRHLGPKSHARGQLLEILATLGREEDLKRLVQHLVDDPPEEDTDVVQALSPLFQKKDVPWQAIFPAIWPALQHLSLAASILDLANFTQAKKLLPQHPATDKQAELIQLLSLLTGRLASLERPAHVESLSATELSKQISQSVALGVSLCHTLAMLNAKDAVGKLYQFMELGHRRLKTEAAAALARLGEKAGVEALVGLAAQPVARLRALAYAEELKALDQVPAEHKTKFARAEGALTVWLAEPTQYGLPPQHCELIDERTQFWPGYSNPVDCFLLRFTYVVTIEGEGERSFSNIGIAGPLTYAFTADLADLPPDDIYATYAGWQTEHEEIREYEVARLNRSGKIEVARLERRLHDSGLEEIRPELFGNFFGEKTLVARAERQGLEGIAVVGADDILFVPTRGARRALGIREVYSLYKGRKLLRTFNRK